MFNYFNKTETMFSQNNLKVKIQVQVEIEESIGRLITGGEKDFQFNTDKKTTITASISPLKSPDIISEIYTLISPIVVEEFKIDRSVLNNPQKSLVESKPFKLEIQIFNIIVSPQTIIDKIIKKISESNIKSYTLFEAKKLRLAKIQDNVLLVSQQANVSEDIARKALEESDVDPAQAIISAKEIQQRERINKNSYESVADKLTNEAEKHRLAKLRPADTSAFHAFEEDLLDVVYNVKKKETGKKNIQHENKEKENKNYADSSTHEENTNLKNNPKRKKRKSISCWISRHDWRKMGGLAGLWKNSQNYKCKKCGKVKKFPI